MKLFGSIAVWVQGEEIMRQPRFLDKVRRAFGGKPDLRTGKMRASIEATAIVDSVRDALRRIGATNAVSLVIDDTVLFHDRDGKPDDLGDLFLAFHDNESVFGQGFRELRLAIEHHEAGLRIVLEVQARSEHPRDQPAVRVIISGRIDALTPKPGEDADTYRRRAEPIATDPKALEMYRHQFTAFVDRVRDAIAAAMPIARVEVEVAEQRVVRPTQTDKPAEPAPPNSRYYDPYDYYYPSTLGMVANTLMWTSLFSMAMPPHFAVIDSHNHHQGFADDPGIQHGPTAADPGDDNQSWWDTGGSHGDSGSDVSAGSDAGVDGGGSWWDNFGGDGGGGDGGDFGGGDFGGGDFGGFGD